MILFVLFAFVAIAVGRPEPQRKPLIGPNGVFFNGKIIHGIHDALHPDHHHHHDQHQPAPFVRPAGTVHPNCFK
jgi:hypothetical protein